MPFAVNQFQCIDPDSIAEAGECNSYRCPVGAAVGIAKVLMWKKDYDALPATPTARLTITDGQGRTVTIRFLMPVSSRVVLQTDTRRTDAVVEVTLADLRWSYRQVSAAESYNYRTTGGGFDAGTTNAGTPWTWDGVAGSLWGKIVATFPALNLGASLTFPTAPAGTPEGLDFDADNVWDALNRVANAAGYVVKYDPLTGVVSFVNPDANAPAFPTNAQAKRTYDDGTWTDPTEWTETARMPTVLSVAFPVPGDPNAVREDANLSEGVVAGPKPVVWDDMPSWGATNATARTNRAAAVAKLWQIDYLSRANPNSIEFLGWAEWVNRAVGTDGWSAWAVYDRGSGTPPGPGGLLTCISNMNRLRTEYMPDGAKYMPAGSGGSTLNTQNTDGTAVDATTTDIQAKKTTGVKFVTNGSVQELEGIPATASQQGVVSTVSQTVGGRKTSVTGTDAVLGGWWATNSALTSWAPAFYSASGSTVTSGSFTVSMAEIAAGTYAAPINFAQIIANFGVDHGSNPSTLGGTGVTLMRTAGGSKLFFLGGAGYGTDDHFYAVARSGAPSIGIDRDFASGDRPIVKGGIIVGYNNP